MPLVFVNSTVGSILICAFRWVFIFIVGNIHVRVLSPVFVICLRLELLDCFPKWLHSYMQCMRAPILPYPHVTDHCVTSWLLLF